ncbi:hypothetical protein [Streptosporangium subroseum]|uniref:hypothetical protein n=1 Tax=Streptosporangium subroseum TaxID=106412 RepID=UPI00117FDFAB|nr:hypothetical protein [Streptosporangium subroseum]
MTIYGLLESSERDHETYRARFIHFVDRGFGPYADSRKRVTRKEIARLKGLARPSRFSDTRFNNHPTGILIECLTHGEVVSLAGYNDAEEKFARTEMAEKTWWCSSCASEVGRDLKQDTSEIALNLGERLLIPDVLGPKGGQHVAGGVYELTTSNRSDYALQPKEFSRNARIAGKPISPCEKWVNNVSDTMFSIAGIWYRVHWLSLSTSTSWHGSGPLLLEPDSYYKSSSKAALDETHGS